MRAIRVHGFGGPEVLKLEDVADLAPGPGQVVVKVHAAGVNPVDTYIRAGGYGEAKFPFTPGFDAAGVIEAVGPAIAGEAESAHPGWTPAVGQRVYVLRSITGCYAEKVLCERAQVHPLAERLSFAQGAGIGVAYATAYRALFQKAKLMPGETVLIHGASGGVGLAAVQLAHAHGARVIGTASTEEGRAMIVRAGCDVAVNHKDAEYLDAIRAASGGGVHVIVEMLANVNLVKDLGLIVPRGRVVIVGNRGTMEFEPRLIMGKEAVVTGFALLAATPAEMREIHCGLAPGFVGGWLTPVVGLEVPLAEAGRAHTEVMTPTFAGGGAMGKIVLVP